ncbi:MAG TPA: hypothetical protein VFE30_05165 [Anaeromyxobacteraceae bacterium]|jgi:hypothetical protein|nr:hypothetical protein [Anaeromyxobacteraceae bacterium]
MARKSGAPGSAGGSGNDDLSDVLAKPGADLPLPTDPVRTAHGAVESTEQEEEYQRTHQPPAPRSGQDFEGEGEAAERQASGNPELEKKQRRGPDEDSDFEI